ncbi:hypothetical protein K435DRAFT_851592 [Dendrothele bispora CBS 962.96]|uniref:Uncharacterized protein n=1 Tax=Dendrothele bispora (strain CBS 962.96) TaxID=1314807 RepID=A0A4S8MMY9_DENBC|nr:hypothetical protein K435DRAFT_851592 [Dendrothele bispora CBS 962.96]
MQPPPPSCASDLSNTTPSLGSTCFTSKASRSRVLVPATSKEAGSAVISDKANGVQSRGGRRGDGETLELHSSELLPTTASRSPLSLPKGTPSASAGAESILALEELIVRRSTTFVHPAGKSKGVSSLHGGGTTRFAFDILHQEPASCLLREEFGAACVEKGRNSGEKDKGKMQEVLKESMEEV